MSNENERQCVPCDMVVIPLHTYEQFVEFRTRYLMLRDHIGKAIDKAEARKKNGENYVSAAYEDGFFKAVIGYEEGGDADA